MARLKTEESRRRSRQIWEALPGTAPAVAKSLGLHRSTVYRQLLLLERHDHVQRKGRTWHPVGTLTADDLAKLWPRVGALGRVQHAYKLARRLADDWNFPEQYREDIKTIRSALVFAESALHRDR